MRRVSSHPSKLSPLARSRKEQYAFLCGLPDTHAPKRPLTVHLVFLMTPLFTKNFRTKTDKESSLSTSSSVVSVIYELAIVAEETGSDCLTPEPRIHHSLQGIGSRYILEGAYRTGVAVAFRLPRSGLSLSGAPGQPRIRGNTPSVVVFRATSLSLLILRTVFETCNHLVKAVIKQYEECDTNLCITCSIVIRHELPAAAARLSLTHGHQLHDWTRRRNPSIILDA
jgi:hypothetical protein